MHSLARYFCVTLSTLALGLGLSSPMTAHGAGVGDVRPAERIEVQPEPLIGPGDVLFSEFRLEGPNGASDEYLELYCNRDTQCDISGYVIVAFDPSRGNFTVAFPPQFVTIRARGHMLVADISGYSLASYAAPDTIASGDGSDLFVDNEGFQLRNPDQTIVIDSVGFEGGGGAPQVNYVEGTGLQRATGARPDDQYAYVRRMPVANAGRPQDTDNNAADFVLVSVTGAAHPGITTAPVLGAPGPQARISAHQSNADVPSTLVEPGVASSSSPNRVRTGSGNSGTISIRRSFTNNFFANESISRLRFRVIDVTTLNTPSIYGSEQQADLRLVTSGNAETFVNSQGRTVVIRGTVLEFDDGVRQPHQPNGGGLNSSVAVDLGNAVIAPGETIDVQFLLNVVQSGRFRFFINVEAEAIDTPSPPALFEATATPSTRPRLGARRPFNQRTRTFRAL